MGRGSVNTQSVRAAFVRAGVLLLLVCGLWPGRAPADEVTVLFKGLRLVANLQLAAGRQPADGVILLTHGGLAHGSMELMSELQALLAAKGRSSLAITLSLGLDNRHGMYDCAEPHRHTNNDALDEIGVWLHWLHEQGARHVVLLGHSRGGAQTALYAARRDSDLFDAVVLLAPATRNNGAAGYAARYGHDLAPLLTRARTLIDKQHGAELLEHVGMMQCSDSRVSAASFVSYYACGDEDDTPSLLPAIHKPVLVLVAGGDELVTGLAPRVEPLLTGGRRQLRVIADSDHFFRNLNADDAVDAIDAFLAGAP